MFKYHLDEFWLQRLNINLALDCECTMSITTELIVKLILSRIIKFLFLF
jgi:hypothetical protein